MKLFNSSQTKRPNKLTLLSSFFQGNLTSKKDRELSLTKWVTIRSVKLWPYSPILDLLTLALDAIPLRRKKFLNPNIWSPTANSSSACVPQRCPEHAPQASLEPESSDDTDTNDSELFLNDKSERDHPASKDELESQSDDLVPML